MPSTMTVSALKQTITILVLMSTISTCAINPAPPTNISTQTRNGLRSNLSQADKLVDPAVMQAALKSLTGKQAIGAEGLIPERGTVQGRALTRSFLKKALESMGYKAEEHNYRPNGSNILTRLMADIPTDEYIVVGAHMDSVRNAGADDNASGTVAVLELARVLKQQPNRKVNILFAWFDEEEIGLVGSRYLAKDLRKQGLKITSMHNIDMLGWDGDKDKAIEVAQPDGTLWDYYNMVNKSHGYHLPFDRSNTGQSDHESFHGEGFDAVCISEEYTSGDLTPHYHRKGDTFETINLDYLTLGTRLMAAVIGDLSIKVPAPPAIQIIPHNRYPSRQREFHSSYEEHLH